MESLCCSIIQLIEKLEVEQKDHFSQISEVHIQPVSLRLSKWQLQVDTAKYQSRIVIRERMTGLCLIFCPQSSYCTMTEIKANYLMNELQKARI